MKTEGFFIQKKGKASEVFELKQFDLPKIEAKQVLVESEAFGLNYADVMARQGLYQEAPPFPCVVGYELVGKIVEVGADVNPDLVGKRVLAFCRFGGYAKHVITEDYAVAEVGNEPAEELMALCTQGVTAYYMANYISPVRKNENVLIHAAAGGVGTMLIQMAKQNGARVIAKVGHSEKEELVKSLGADDVVNYRTSDYKNQVNGVLKNERLDASFNPAAGSTYKKDLSLLGSGGRLFLFGASELSSGKWGIFSKLNFVKKMGFAPPIGFMMLSKSVLGVNMLKIADNKPQILADCLKSVVELYKDGQLTPQVGGKFPKNQLPEAHKFLESGKSTGKISVFWD